MTKRREVAFETDTLIVDRPNKAEVEVLCGRAARMAYLTEYELEQLIEENRFILESMPVFSRDSLPVPPRQSASIHSVNLHNIITPLLQIIQTGPIVILDNQLTGCQVHLFRIFDEIWITFRGTNMKDIGSLRKDMKTDLNFSQRHPSYLPESHQAHRGFDESYMSVREELRTEVDAIFAFEGELPLRIIGHSLGGALATLAAFDFAVNMNLAKSISIRTFGCPCVGNKAFCDDFDMKVSDSIRYTIYMDPVPMLLSEISAFGYFHVGRWVQMNETKRKHNVEHYIKILCRYAHVDDDIEEEYDEEIFVEEEEIFYTSQTKQNAKLLALGGSLLILAIYLYKK